MMPAARALLSTLLVLTALTGRAQQPAARSQDWLLKFAPVAGGRPLVQDSSYHRLRGGQDSFRIDVFRCYISGVQLIKAGKVVHTAAAKFQLLDLAAPESFSVSLPGSAGLAPDAIRFMLGIDSATNAAGAGGGVLDPVNGMYWAWQSGYVNLKLEGVSPLCDSRRHQFQFHLGGFREGQLCARQVELPVNGPGPVVIVIELDHFLAGIDLRTENTIMSPGAAAIRLSELAASVFTTKTVGP